MGMWDFMECEAVVLEDFLMNTVVTNMLWGHREGGTVVLDRAHDLAIRVCHENKKSFLNYGHP